MDMTAFSERTRPPEISPSVWGRYLAGLGKQALDSLIDIEQRHPGLVRSQVEMMLDSGRPHELMVRQWEEG